ncbi:hypothetical protein CEXT_664161 [Caerostris extrusa]|uniref:Uncharacterized protein n=1 Tax=Caerostris extrusa TaxID=172846 RepID=A0AAV4RNN6_CAEEX|nr:hypothetical protein CEXT_664161 [Caerostris extrusa]
MFPPLFFVHIKLFLCIKITRISLLTGIGLVRGGLEWESEEGRKQMVKLPGKLRLQKMLQRINPKNKCARRTVYTGWKEGGDLRMVVREMGRKTKFQWRAEILMGTLEGNTEGDKKDSLFSYSLAGFFIFKGST